MRCKICNFETVLWKDPRYKHAYYTCPHCEGVFLDARFYPSSETEQNVYANHHNSLENEGYVRMFENFIDFFLGYLTCQREFAGFRFRPDSRFKRTFAQTKRPRRLLRQMVSAEKNLYRSNLRRHYLNRSFRAPRRSDCDFKRIEYPFTSRRNRCFDDAVSSKNASGFFSMVVSSRSDAYYVLHTQNNRNNGRTVRF